MSDQKIHAFICTRNKELTTNTQRYISYLALCGVEVKLLVNQKSIFSGYKKAYTKANPDPEDIIILSHDDIMITMPYPSFTKTLTSSLSATTGFVGVAGTTYLAEDAVWWEHTRWEQGHHSGAVYHTNKAEVEKRVTQYGPPRQVVVLDGLFLAARAKVLEEIGLDKPSYLKGDWDFYDLHYTLSAHRKGYINKTIPLPIIHYSRGELAGRDSWHENRELFSTEYKKEFPIKC